MSHFTVVKCNIKELPLLTKAAKALGLESVERKNVNGYMGNQTNADAVFKVSDQYDVGAVKDKQSGNYDLIADWWGTNFTIQNLSQKLQQEYAVQTVLRRAKLMGHEVERKVENDGSVRLVVKTR